MAVHEEAQYQAFAEAMATASPLSDLPPVVGDVAPASDSEEDS
jgi:hypothetical protein